MVEKTIPASIMFNHCFKGISIAACISTMILLLKEMSSLSGIAKVPVDSLEYQ